MNENWTAHLLPTDFTKAYYPVNTESDSTYDVGFRTKLIALIKKYLNKTCSKCRLCKHLPDVFRIPNSLKERHASLLLFLCFSFAESKGQRKSR